MAYFTTRSLTGERVLVKGTDDDGTEGSVVLNGAEWASIKARQDFGNAKANYDELVEEFFKPLLEAAETFEKAVEPKQPDPATVVVLHEGSEGSEAVASEVINLGHDSIVLRLIEEGDTSRLVWVDGNLEILEAEAEPTPTPAPVSFPDDVWVDRSNEVASHDG